MLERRTRSLRHAVRWTVAASVLGAAGASAAQAAPRPEAVPAGQAATGVTRAVEAEACPLGQWRTAADATRYREAIVHTTHVFIVNGTWDAPGCAPAPIQKLTLWVHWADRPGIWGKGWVFAGFDPHDDVEKTFLKIGPEVKKNQPWADWDEHRAAWRTYDGTVCPEGELCLYREDSGAGGGVRFVDAPDVTDLSWWDMNDATASYRNNTPYDFCWYADYGYRGEKGLWKARGSVDVLPEGRRGQVSSLAPARPDAEGNSVC
ncbi:peptidase inhibitor family I36 protein [Streptomyces sp. NPDC094049]|uniref:peptidase inhibitor family I36 protein n=1 Tax=Streptomyces sp. NPDC094049 TaxID=3154987 RepID=UPI00332EC321